MVGRVGFDMGEELGQEVVGVCCGGGDGSDGGEAFGQGGEAGF